MNGARPRPAQLPLGLAANSRASFEGFVIGANSEAVAAVRTLAAGGNGAIFVHGPADSGKTHLLQAACRVSAAAGQHALYLSLADTTRRPTELLSGLDDLDMLCLDDVGAAPAAGGWQAALLPLLDSVRAHQGAVLFAAQDLPDALDLDLPDLRSRLGWATRYRLHSLDDAGRSELLKRRAAERGLELPEELAAYLLLRLPRSSSSLVAAVDQLDTASLAEKRRLTIPLAREVLKLG